MDVKPLEQLTYADFAKALKMKFRVWIDAGDSVEFELLEVTTPRLAASAGAKKATLENFALIFVGPADRPLPQRIYRFESGVLGRFDLYIVPGRHGAGGIQYQATFNRELKPE